MNAMTRNKDLSILCAGAQKDCRGKIEKGGRGGTLKKWHMTIRDHGKKKKKKKPAH